MILLRKSLELVGANLLPTTPTQVYIFAAARKVERVAASLGALANQSHIKILPLTNASWTVPYMGEEAWWHGHYTVDYRLMGDWRLAFLPQFVRDMGHRYVLQLDDDSFITGPVGSNLVELFDSNKLVLGARKKSHETSYNSWGLPELARYFIVTHKMVPTQLFEHCEPPSLAGLYTAFEEKEAERFLTPQQVDTIGKIQLPTTGGWDKAVLFGNCVMYSIDWWFSPLVSRFVQLCRATGGHFTYRWNEQAVIGMLWQIFVDPNQFKLFDFPYEHRYLANHFVKEVEGEGTGEEPDGAEGAVAKA
ncbi:hypothetical protein HYH03_015720 [Edaphochlamys debaryana]|uniref:Uncharacterized protein n=1 Tax=Edaphochlamys debaryana TaxID=47281 RepID=A0A835XT85_9CHLO|nr:hypothetical protein HYH03_015720 [Edaphochlamys debaryana]|eukprot:KAG2485554.1 hypothetical protein HYH03_015720 [Edaphochlamys debaryana]